MKLTPAIFLDNVSVTYNTDLVLEQISASIPQGTLTAIIGPNGAGKSTLLKAMVGLVPLKKGTIKIFGCDFRQVTETIAYVGQRATIDWDFPATVSDVVLMGRYKKIGWFRSPGKADYEAVQNALQLVGMTQYARIPIGALSGGQQQRTFLARALVQDASLYLMDEPFTGIDAPTEEIIVAILKQLKKSGKTIIAVHHDLQTVHSYFDWGLLLNRTMIAAGSIEETVRAEYVCAAYGKKDVFVERSL